MKCPRCGTANGKTNKFCRECGLRMDGLAQKQQAQPHVSVADAPDELALAEAVGAAWELVKSGSLDDALVTGEAMLRENPDSASVHWLVASSYERKADSEFAQGNTDSGQDWLKRAVAQYEGIIDLNPDSAADREKLAALRRRLAGGVAAGQWVAAPTTGFRAVLANVPRPVLAGMGALLLLIIVMIMLIPGAGREKGYPASEEPRRALGPSTAGPTVTRNAPSGPSSSSLRVYTYPSTSSPARTSSAAPDRESPRPQQSERNVRVPSVPEPELTIVSEPKKSPPPKVAPPAVRPPPSESRPSSSTGSRMLAEAIQLHGQGLHEESIAAAERAIGLYQADIDAGRNAESARRGIENARNLVAVWEQSGPGNSEEQ